MEFIIDRDVFLKSLGNANGIIERKTTLPILSNILLEVKNSKVRITSTDLDIIYFEEVSPIENNSLKFLYPEATDYEINLVQTANKIQIKIILHLI